MEEHPVVESFGCEADEVVAVARRVAVEAHADVSGGGVYVDDSVVSSVFGRGVVVLCHCN